MQTSSKFKLVRFIRQKSFPMCAESPSRCRPSNPVARCVFLLLLPIPCCSTIRSSQLLGLIMITEAAAPLCRLCTTQQRGDDPLSNAKQQTKGTTAYTETPHDNVSFSAISHPRLVISSHAPIAADSNAVVVKLFLGFNNSGYRLYSFAKGIHRVFC